MNLAPPRAALVRTRDALQESLDSIRSSGAVVGLIPTMGALHPGHLSLMDRAVAVSDVRIASVFVNPLQFGPGEDLDRYPRRLDRDVELASSHSVHVIFAPEVRGMFPWGEPDVQVDPGPMGERLCGGFRPGHFRGVLTVVLKLFELIRPNVAVFGRKDLQQVALIRRMVRDLDIPVRIEQAPIVRDEAGLALSSRNAYLSPDERGQALGLFRAATAADEAFRGGEVRRSKLLGRVQEVVAEHPGLIIQYADVVDPETLEPQEEASQGAAIALAGFSGKTRLIDNLLLGAESSDPRVTTRIPLEPDSR